MKGVLVIISTVFFTSCTYTTGEGPIIEREFDLEKFSGVELDGSFDVKIEQGTMQKVVVFGQENIIEKLKMNVLDSILYLSLEPGNYLNYELEVQLIVPDLKLARLLGSGDIKLGTFVGLRQLNVEVDGSGDIKTIEESVLEVTQKASVELDGSGDIELKMKSADTGAKLDGSGDIELRGFTEQFSAILDGSGDIKAYDLESMSCEAELDGSGTIKVYATKTLKADLNGSGDIKYKGEPTVEASIDGSGSISSK